MKIGGGEHVKVGLGNGMAIRMWLDLESRFDIFFCLEVWKNTDAHKPSKRLESGAEMDSHPPNKEVSSYEPLGPIFVDPKAHLPGPAVASGVDPRVKTYGSWVLFWTPKIIINYPLIYTPLLLRLLLSSKP